MNIFKILSSGHGSIGETNISAFLGYLLNPNEDHGLGANFLRQILLEHYKQNSEISTIKNLYASDLGQIVDLSSGSGYLVDVFLEQGFKSIIDDKKSELLSTTTDEKKKDKLKEIVDILVFIYKIELEGSQDLAIQHLTKRKRLSNIILVEVKTNPSSARTTQLVAQIINSKKVIKYLTENENLNINVDPSVLSEISMIYITPKGCEESYSALNTSKLSSHPTSHIIWSSKDNEEGEDEGADGGNVETIEEDERRASIESIINKIINNEFDIKMERIPEYTAQTLQSFSNFIYVDFKFSNKKKPSGDKNKIFYNYKDFQDKYRSIYSKYWPILNIVQPVLENYKDVFLRYSESHLITAFLNKKNRGKIFSYSKDKIELVYRIYKIEESDKDELINTLKKLNLKITCDVKGDVVSIDNSYNMPQDQVLSIFKLQYDAICKFLNRKVLK